MFKKLLFCTLIASSAIAMGQDSGPVISRSQDIQKHWSTIISVSGTKDDVLTVECLNYKASLMLTITSSGFERFGDCQAGVMIRFDDGNAKDWGWKASSFTNAFSGNKKMITLLMSAHTVYAQYQLLSGTPLSTFPLKGVVEAMKASPDCPEVK